MSRTRHSRRICSVAFGAATALIGACGVSAAAECGVMSPSYRAERTLTIGGSTIKSVVYESGTDFREETDVRGHRVVTLRLPKSGFLYTFDTTTKEGLKLPVPPQPRNTKTRTVEEKSGDDTVYHKQFESRGRWIELSATHCNMAGVMTAQTFTSIDPQGNMVDGTIGQGNIVVGPVDPGLFQVPLNVTLKQP